MNNNRALIAQLAMTAVFCSFGFNFRLATATITAAARLLCHGKMRFAQTLEFDSFSAPKMSIECLYCFLLRSDTFNCSPSINVRITTKILIQQL